MTEKQNTREIMDKIYEMTPEEVTRFLGEHFRRLCSKPLPDVQTTPSEGSK